ncbi:MAG TPA: bifunctional diaminohydroxyphosphoribosylaminopyrimidine deaminase/5-amino-6-(5-phosphoribosylamino)uracil reductase RibD [Steroidobacteraceae bacterium]|nr:bifunctional diaminohydroxyphosphoribosylaminopyrimidine deaminase/5-amino-6-(5-phosphoribosylamino)uracil reductase RibD [Steroidobacteraceae bacterium]
MFSDFDYRAMARAVALAARGLETTDPNPRVGCVIARGEEIVGEGWHERAGEPHAEVNALRAAGPNAAGATAYVTLEPCSHHGRTPPCADALIAARLARVIFAVEDPNPRVSGRGAEALRQAGIAVESGLLQAEAAELNPGFLKRMRRGRPWVRLKLAMSLDGRTALANGVSQWITGPAAREDVQRWRARSSAIMTGIGTVLADDPRLNVRLADPSPGRPRRQPLRVVLDCSLRTPLDAKLLTGDGSVLIITAARQDQSAVDHEKRRAGLLERGAAIEEVSVSSEAARPARLRLPEVLDALGRREVNELWVESGPRLAGDLLRQKLIDELLVYVAPKLLGPQARPLAEIEEVCDLSAAPDFVILDTCKVGDDVRLRLRPQHEQR